MSRVLPDNAYRNRPPIEIEQDLQQGLDAIQEERMIVEPTLVEPPKPTNKEDDIGDMYVFIKMDMPPHDTGCGF